MHVTQFDFGYRLGRNAGLVAAMLGAASFSWARPYHIFEEVGSTGPGLTAFENLVSINNEGSIACVGRTTTSSSSEKLYLSVDSAQIAPVSLGTTRYSRYLQLADGDLFAAATTGVSSNIRVYDVPGGTSTLVASTSNPAYDLVARPSVNNSGDVVFTTSGGPAGGVMTSLIHYEAGNVTSTILSQGPGNFNILPMLSDSVGGTQVVVVRDGSSTSSPIRTYFVNEAPPVTYSAADVATAFDFDSVGSGPGISDEGDAVAFYGDPATEGDGIFVAFNIGGRSGGTANWQRFRIAQAVTEPGFFAGDVQWTTPTSSPVPTCALGNRTFGLTAKTDIDTATIVGFYPNERVNIQLLETEPGANGRKIFRVLFAANMEWQENAGSPSKALYTATVALTESPTVDLEILAGPQYFCGLAEEIEILDQSGQTSSLDLTSMTIHDSLNKQGQIAFWANSSTGQKIIKAQSVIEPLRQNQYPWAGDVYAKAKFDQYVDRLHQAVNPGPAEDLPRRNTMMQMQTSGTYTLGAKGCTMTSLAMALNVLKRENRPNEGLVHTTRSIHEIAESTTGLLTDISSQSRCLPKAAGSLWRTGGAITIPDSGNASPYPSTVMVSGYTNAAPGSPGDHDLLEIEVTLNNVTHPNPDDLDVLLVSPSGEKVVLMSDAGGTANTTNRNLTFTRTVGVGAVLPDSSALSSGRYRPSNYGSGDVFPAPAPAAPYTSGVSSLNGFIGEDPNGTWSLYVVDDTPSSSGSIGSWTLRLGAKRFSFASKLPVFNGADFFWRDSNAETAFGMRSAASALNINIRRDNPGTAADENETDLQSVWNYLMGLSGGGGGATSDARVAIFKYPSGHYFLVAGVSRKVGPGATLVRRVYLVDPYVNMNVSPTNPSPVSHKDAVFSTFASFEARFSDANRERRVSAVTYVELPPPPTPDQLSPPQRGLGSPALALIRANSGVDFIVTSPSGQRAGCNSLTGEVFDEIPGAVYSRETPADPPEGWELATDEEIDDYEEQGPRILSLASAESGDYEVEVFGSQDFEEVMVAFESSDGAGGGSVSTQTVMVEAGGSATATHTSGGSAAPVLFVSDVIVLEDAGSAVFEVQLSHPFASAVTFDFTTVDGTAVEPSDYTESTGTGNSIPAGMLSTTVSVPIFDDGDEEAPEYLSLVLSNVSGAQLLDDTAVATIVDNDTDYLALFDAAAAAAGLVGNDALPGAAPFGEASVNLLKYAFNMNLGAPDSHVLEPGGSSGLPRVEVVDTPGGPVFRMEFIRGKTNGIVYTPMKSSSLEVGSFGLFGASEQITEIDADWQRVRIDEPVDPLLDETLFGTIHVALP